MPRRNEVNTLHNLVDLFLIGVILVICGAQTQKQMSEFANFKMIWIEALKKNTQLPTFGGAF